MIGTLGTSIVFEVSDDTVFTFDALERTVTGRWASHETMGKKPKSEFLGAENQAITFTIYLSALLGVPPRETMETIADMVENGTAEYLVIGSSVVGANPFRIMSVSEAWDKIYNDGEVAQATLSVTLEEYT